jgi:outer membrane protein assembly factor BamB
MAAVKAWRSGDALALGGVLLLLVYAGLLLFERGQAQQPRQTVDAALEQELADAEFLDEPPPPAGAWPQWRGVGRDGVAHEPHLLTRWPADGPARLWEAPGGTGYSSFAISGGRAYTMLYQGGREAVVCLDAGGGKELWRHAYEAPSASDYPGPRSTPTLDGDRVYAVGFRGQFHCLDAATGRVLWQHDLAKELHAPGGQWGQAFSPLVEGDLVITTPGGASSLAAFHKVSSKLAWTSLSDPPGYSSPVAFTASGVRQVVAFTGSAVVGVAPSDGRLGWRFPWETSFNVNAATPIVFHTRRAGAVHDYVFVSSGYGKGCALLRIQKTAAGDFTARPVFENNLLCSHFSSPVRYRDHVYGFNETTLVCMDLRSGRVRWTQHGFDKGSLLRADDHLVVFGGRGQLALLKASPEQSRLLARTQPLHSSRECWTMPALGDGRLYLRDHEKVVCLDLRGQ